MPRKNSQNWSAGDQVTAARLQNINQDLDDLYSQGNDRGRVSKAASGTALRIDVGAFAWRVGEVLGFYNGGTDIVVTNNATNYIEVDQGGAIQVNTTGWTTTRARLATVVCSGGAVTTITVWKSDVVGGQLSGNASAFSDITSTTFSGDKLTGMVADSKTYTLTYDATGRLQSYSNGTNTWTATYTGTKLTSTVKS